MENKDLAVLTPNNKAVALDMIPAQALKSNYVALAQIAKDVLKDNHDYGVIPGTGKPTLLQAGAEKLKFLYGLRVEHELVEKEVDLWGEKHGEAYIDYTYKCSVYKGDMKLADKEGNCNSLEKKYRYITMEEHQVPSKYDLETLEKIESTVEEPAFALKQKQTGGQWGKPMKYWDKLNEMKDTGDYAEKTKQTSSGKDMKVYVFKTVKYRVPNPHIADLKNTIMKMAQKRAFVGAILTATGASEFFTQDVEDMDLNDSEDLFETSNKTNDSGNDDSNEDTDTISSKKNALKAISEAKITNDLNEIYENLNISDANDMAEVMEALKTRKKEFADKMAKNKQDKENSKKTTKSTKKNNKKSVKLTKSQKEEVENIRKGIESIKELKDRGEQTDLYREIGDAIDEYSDDDLPADAKKGLRQELVDAYMDYEEETNEEE